APLVRARRELLGLEAAPLGVAREHAVDVARPERGLVAADALPDLDDHVLGIGGVALDQRQAKLFLEPVEPLLALAHELAQNGVLASGLDIGAGLPPILRQPVGLLEPPPHAA